MAGCDSAVTAVGSQKTKQNSNPRKQKQNLMHKQKYAKLAEITTRMRLFVVQTAIQIMG